MATWGTPISLKGKDGEPGLSVLTTYGAPKDADGKDGQSAITDAGELYFRSNGTWAKVRSLVGQSGMNGLNAQLLRGEFPPDGTSFSNDSDAIYFQDGTGQVFYYDFEGDKTWTDAGYSIRGEVGQPGADGLRGSQQYFGSGPPSADLSSFSPPAAPRDTYLDQTSPNGPFLYVLGS